MSWSSACYLLHGPVLGFLLDPEDGGDVFLSHRNTLEMTKLNSPGILVKTISTRWNIWTSWRSSLREEVAQFSMKWNSFQCGCLPGNQLCRQQISVLRLHFRIVPDVTISQPAPRNSFYKCVFLHI
jgi:hypothetical protein